MPTISNLKVGATLNADGSITQGSGGLIQINVDNQTGNLKTNLWADQIGWFEITDAFAKQTFISIFNSNHYDLKKLAVELLKYKDSVSNTLLSIGKPYRRPRPNTTLTYDSNTTNIDENISESQVPTINLFEDACENILLFFSEFSLKPQNRFINQLIRLSMSKNNTKLSQEYASNYARLIDSYDSESIRNKVKSSEFKELIKYLGEIATKYFNETNTQLKQINNRLEIFFGPAGSGKTTEAINSHPDAAVMVCYGGLLPDELFRTFDFEDEFGKPVFKDSELVKAMINGKPIILDEFNLLDLPVLRALQGILDGKKVFNYNGRQITIQDGFKVIATMNLEVNGQVYGLPEPIVDRAEILKEFNLSSKELLLRSI